MKIKLLQLNIWAGTHFPVIRQFLEHNGFDILCFQEVAGPNSHSGNFHSQEDQFLRLQNFLGSQYHGQLAIAMHFSSDPIHSYDGNAIFYKNQFQMVEKHTLTLYKGIDPFPSDLKTYEEQGRNALRLTLKKDSQTINVITTHLAWAPTQSEHPHQRKQNLHLIEYVKNLPTPWILTGDFNMEPKQQTILDFEQLGHNLIKDYNIQNTIDPKNHTAWDKIKPGFPVDYIFVSPDVKVDSFEALKDVHMSDHLGLITVIEV